MGTIRVRLHQTSRSHTSQTSRLQRPKRIALGRYVYHAVKPEIYIKMCLFLPKQAL